MVSDKFIYGPGDLTPVASDDGEDDDLDLEDIFVDEDPISADWLRYTFWSLPPYKTDEFYQIIGYDRDDLAEFRTWPVYLGAVARGLIVDDVWRPDVYAREQAELARMNAEIDQADSGTSED